MDSDEDNPYYDIDSGNESSGDDVDFPMDVEANNPRERHIDVDDYPFEVLSTEEIVQHMVDSIKEVNTVVEVMSITRMQLGLAYLVKINHVLPGVPF